MKTYLCASLLSVASSLVANSAIAQPFRYQAVIFADLEVVSSTHYTGAQVKLDGRRRTIDLSLQPVMPPCAAGFMCAQVMPEPIAYALEKSRTTIDDCGIIRTVASIDQRPVDGVFLKVSINNNRHNTCPTLVALPALDVTVEQKYYDRINGREVTQNDRFAAQDFAQIKPAGK